MIYKVSDKAWLQKYNQNEDTPYKYVYLTVVLKSSYCHFYGYGSIAQRQELETLSNMTEATKEIVFSSIRFPTT